MKKKRKLFLTILLIIVILVLIFAGGKTYLENNLNRLANTPVPDVDFSALEDGKYFGSYKAFPITAEVEVFVKSHKISAINLTKHVNGQGKPAEIIISKVIEKQSLQVDSISGATYSSKVILKAIEDALTSVSNP